MSQVTQVPVSERFEENISYLQKELRIDKSFDVIHHKLEYGGLKFGLFFVDGFAKDDVMVNIMRHINALAPRDLRSNPIEVLTRSLIPYIELETTEDLEEVITQVLSGQAALIVEGATKAILIDIREYPSRTPEEPDIERVVRGPRDGFVETLVFNTALIRRRIRDRSLVMRYKQVGQRSKTDIVLAYMDSIADPDLVKLIDQKLNEINIDGLSMAEKTIEEFIFGRYMNPYPLVRFTERADTSAVHLLEGHVLIIVDGSPSVLICPTTFWHHLQHAEEYRQKPVVGAFLRWVRFTAIFTSLFVLPLWYVLATNPHLLPERWDFIGPDDVGHLSLFWQFFLAEIGTEILRMAAIHTPSALATALGLVAAILIGEIAVQVGLFTNEVILYVAISVMGTYATPSYELSLANRMFRIIFLIAGAVFGLYGFTLAVAFWVILLASTKTLNVPYLWPLIPLDIKALYEVLVRTPVPLKKTRPAILDIEDADKLH
ncbi:GerA spore germination protein [Caldalkalibacillus thermarum TA2.A1]|uniref:Spore germination protein n=1 Tax=Caldalkalibacillus thermarum (strain TA2.A1) TaxID=986075 RepID=F5L7N8_CALTT|nr:spore germination protein [Caldalkalibacillus thermarum]EGL82614.1 GerA spore germination protein [Caldalkalibacillus thermarum TA2.A1]QZT33326.1 spore germination protein [Caldalkalibacillus thermarum TA2.A1]